MKTEKLCNLLLNMSGGLRPDQLSWPEIQLLKTEYGVHWFRKLGYKEPQYINPNNKSLMARASDGL